MLLSIFFYTAQRWSLQPNEPRWGGGGKYYPPPAANSRAGEVGEAANESSEQELLR